MELVIFLGSPFLFNLVLTFFSFLLGLLFVKSGPLVESRAVENALAVLERSLLLQDRVELAVFLAFGLLVLLFLTLEAVERGDTLESLLYKLGADLLRRFKTFHLNHAVESIVSGLGLFDLLYSLVLPFSHEQHCFLGHQMLCLLFFLHFLVLLCFLSP